MVLVFHNDDFLTNAVGVKRMNNKYTTPTGVIHHQRFNQAADTKQNKNVILSLKGKLHVCVSHMPFLCGLRDEVQNLIFCAKLQIR